MDFQKRGNKIVAAALCAALVFTMSGALSVGAAKQSDEEKLKAQIAQYEKTLNEQKDDISQKEEYNKTLDAQIAVMNEKITADQARIDSLNNEIRAKNDEIASLENQINERQADIDAKNADIEQKEDAKQATLDQLRERIRASYMAGQSSSLELLLSSEDFGKFLSNYEYMKRISKHDQELAQNYADQVREIEEARAQVEQAKAELETEKSSKEQSVQQVEAKKAELTEAQADQKATADSLKNKLAENNRDLGQLNQEYTQNQMELQQSQEDLKAIEAELAELSKNSMSGNSSSSSSKPNSNSGSSNSGGQSSDNSQSGGNQNSQAPDPDPEPDQGSSDSSNSAGFVWPVPGHTYVSQGYKGTAHTGIDIPAPVNTPIVAVKAGRVKEAYPNGRQTGNGWWTYGKYLIIDHGNGEVTLYAHCNYLNVSAGDYVSQGQVIAGVGNTGNSFGNHLHIELYRNGGRVDPQSYLR